MYDGGVVCAILLPRHASPRDDAIDEFALLGRCAAKVDARRLDGLMPHQVGKERDVVELRQKVLCETVPEGVRIDHFRIDAVILGQLLQLVADAASRDALAEAVAEEIATCASSFRKPLFRLSLEAFRYIETTKFSTLAVEIKIACLDVFNLDFQQFLDAVSRGAKVAHHEVPVEALLGFQLPAEEAVIRVADDVLQKVLLLNLDELHLEIRLLHEVEIAIQGLQAQIHGLRLVVLNQPSFIG